MAGMALRIAKRDVQSLTKAEMANVRATQQMAHYALFAGGAMLIFGGMMARALTQIMDKYAQTSSVMLAFHNEMDEAMHKFARSLINILGPTLLWLAKLFNKIADSPVLAWLVSAGAVVLILGGAIGFLLGGFLQLIQFAGLAAGKIGLATLAVRLFGHETGLAASKTQAYIAVLNHLKVQADVTTPSVISLGTAVAGVFASVMIGISAFMVFKDLLGPVGAAIVALTLALIPLVALLWKGAAAMSILSWGAAAVVGIGAIIGMLSKIEGFQKGTSFVRKGGLAMLHGGEEIKSARETTATSLVERQRRGETGAGVSTTTNMWRVPITIEHVHTKAEFEDMDEKLGEAMRKAGRRAR